MSGLFLKLLNMSISASVRSWYLRIYMFGLDTDLVRGWYRVDMNLSSYVPAIANLFFTLFYVF